jgi:hypothetical protein
VLESLFRITSIALLATRTSNWKIKAVRIGFV